MKALDIHKIESELKKRCQYPYQWFRKQNNNWDALTNFIYATESWEEMLQKSAGVARTETIEWELLFQYASNRWYNFWSAKAVEQIFVSLDGVQPANNYKDSEKDFFLFNIPFDHKTSVFPKEFGKSIQYAQEHKKELITWLYNNQSSQNRHHLKNRLFIIVYDQNGQHWKMKAELNLLKEVIKDYLTYFNPEQLLSFQFIPNETTLSDIIWVVR